MTFELDRSCSPAAAIGAAALSLIRSQRTMVLATCDQEGPWCAPVYYVHDSAGFYFFSSPQSLHIRHITSGGLAAAAIFNDDGRWPQIRGLQMSGDVCAINGSVERLRLTGRFLIKFPFSKDFLRGGVENIPDLSSKVQLYGFVPRAIYWLDNSVSFGRKVSIDPSAIGANPATKE
jgi:uncharacterized protein YhbP (UPF0306 family)